MMPGGIDLFAADAALFGFFPFQNGPRAKGSGRISFIILDMSHLPIDGRISKRNN
jgi:hypothetical protein